MLLFLYSKVKHCTDSAVLYSGRTQCVYFVFCITGYEFRFKLAPTTLRL